MTRTVHICTGGECQGECYRCRLLACSTKRQTYQRLLCWLVDRCVAQGSFGPFCEEWQASEEWKALWDDLDGLRDEVASASATEGE